MRRPRRVEQRRLRGPSASLVGLEPLCDRGLVDETRDGFELAVGADRRRCESSYAHFADGADRHSRALRMRRPRPVFARRTMRCWRQHRLVRSLGRRARRSQSHSSSSTAACGSSFRSAPSSTSLLLPRRFFAERPVHDGRPRSAFHSLYDRYAVAWQGKAAADTPLGRFEGSP